mmetsp:Transcript_9130/g.21977  ORF Transcript_9130/g.21977 Transcript_9130/m.21977 type:complete len:302 (-) Transcript_9130:3057-3962(-)
MSRLEVLCKRLLAKERRMENSESLFSSQKELSDHLDSALGDGAHGKLRNSIYGSRTYWESRYSGDYFDTETLGTEAQNSRRGLSTEWYLSYQEIKPYLGSDFLVFSRVLVPGCGISTLGAELEADGYQEVYCIDYSRFCIERMKDRARRSGSAVVYETMDVTNLKYEDGSFGCVFDKATLDSLMNADDGGAGCAAAMLREAARVLSPGGLYICVSHSDRREMLAQVGGGGGSGCPWAIVHEAWVKKNRAAYWLAVLEKKRDGLDPAHRSDGFTPAALTAAAAGPAVTSGARSPLSSGRSSP